MSDSILDNTKKLLGIAEDYAAFDMDVMTHINSALTRLAQLGLGPTNGFRIEDNIATWGDFLTNDTNTASVKTYVYLKVRMLFDPPATSYLITAFEKEIQMLEWCLNVEVDHEDAQPSFPVLDGGDI